MAKPFPSITVNVFFPTRNSCILLSHNAIATLEWSEDQDSFQLRCCSKNGMTVDEIDVPPFKDATAGVYDKLGYGALRDELQAIAAK